MVARFKLHLTCRLGLLAVLLGSTLSLSGCAVFDRERWDFNRYRDERAVDIDQRLEQSAPPVENPF